MELNVKSNTNMNKPKKFQQDVQKLSNSQSLNSSLNFSWSDNKNGITGKVFRKKNSNVKPTDNVTMIDLTNSESKVQAKHVSRGKADLKNLKNDAQAKLTHKSKNYVKETQSHTVQENDSSGVNIKRKHKKDKAKALLNKGDGSEDKSISKVQSKSFSLFTEKPKDLYVSARSGKSVSEKVFNESGSKFSDLSIHKHLVSNLEKINFTTLTTVQEKAIPVVLSGKDVLIRSQTGSGKTLAYAVPIVDALQSITPRLQRKDSVQAIVVVPTRELALQTHELFNKINTFQWIVIGHLCGGENRKTEKDRLRKGLHVLIGTPGRLLDHVLHTSALNLSNVRCLVLDEADRLLDMGFRKDIISLVEQLTKVKSYMEYNPIEMLKSQNSKTDFEEDSNELLEEIEEFPLKNVGSKNRQTILLSATLNKGVSELADFTMKNHVFVNALKESLINSTAIKTDLVIPDAVKQEFILTYVKHRLFTLSALIIAKCKQNSKIFIFMASTQMVEYYHELFTRCLVSMPVSRGKLRQGNVVLLEANSDESDGEEEQELVLKTRFFKLHGNMDQKARKEVFTSFRDAKTGVLLCTDVAARGLDVPTADCIIQYTGPQTDEDYLHRVGRTGRAGQPGSAIIFLTHEEQEYISHLNEQRVFLKQRDSQEYLRYLCDIMQQPDHEKAAEALQRRYETTVAKDKALHLSACLAYSTWSRFYNSYPAKMRSIFNFKNINLGHYATSFALRDTPSQISRVVRGQVAKTEPRRLNKKLSNHMKEDSKSTKQNKNIKRSVNLMPSEYSSGLEPVKKKKKKSVEDK